MPKQFPSEFRVRLVELHRAGRSVNVLAEQFHVSQACLYRWIKQDRIDRGELPGISSTENAELKAARKRIRMLEEELAITRKAAEIFANQDLPPKGFTR